MAGDLQSEQLAQLRLADAGRTGENPPALQRIGDLPSLDEGDFGLACNTWPIRPVLPTNCNGLIKVGAGSGFRGHRPPRNLTVRRAWKILHHMLARPEDPRLGRWGGG